MNNLCKNRVSYETISNMMRLGLYRQRMPQARVSQQKKTHLYDEGTCKRDCGAAGQRLGQLDADTASVPNFPEKLAS
jgi:hypothetical protein